MLVHVFLEAGVCEVNNRLLQQLGSWMARGDGVIIVTEQTATNLVVSVFATSKHYSATLNFIICPPKYLDSKLEICSLKSTVRALHKCLVPDFQMMYFLRSDLEVKQHGARQYLMCHLFGTPRVIYISSLCDNRLVKGLTACKPLGKKAKGKPR